MTRFVLCMMVSPGRHRSDTATTAPPAAKGPGRYLWMPDRYPAGARGSDCGGGRIGEATDHACAGHGYRFMIRRLEHALVRRDVRMIDDPMRSQINALAVGAVLAAVILAGCAIWGMIRLRGRRRFGDRRRKRQRRNVCGRIRSIAPVLNLASARLITGRPIRPRSVADKKLSGYPRGPLLGIPGHRRPTRSGEWRTRMDGMRRGGAVERRYRRCAAERDRGTASSGGLAAPASRRSALLISHADKTFLVYRPDGDETAVRAEVDLESVEVRSVPVIGRGRAAAGQRRSARAHSGGTAHRPATDCGQRPQRCAHRAGHRRGVGRALGRRR